MRLACLAALATALGAVSGCREEPPAPFSPRFLPHDGGVDAGGFDPPTGTSTTGSGGPTGSGAPTVSENGCVGNFSDNFNDGVDRQVWTPDPGCNATVKAEGDEVVLSRDVGCGSSESRLLLKSGLFLCGDFDVSVDYRMPDWNPLEVGARWTTLRAQTSDFDLGEGNGIAVERLGGQLVSGDCRGDPDVYMAWTSTPSTCAAADRDAIAITTATAGRLRVSRRGPIVTAYIQRSGWEKLLEVEGPTQRLRLGLTMGSSGAAHRVFFDDLSVTSERE